MDNQKLILTKQDQVVEQIREQIIAGEYERGERLKQADIALKLGVSVTPVREALKALEMEGYVRSFPNRGIYIPEYSGKDIQEIFRLRLMLEEFLVTQALESIRQPDIDDLRRIQDQFLACLHEQDYVGMRIANVKFHFKLYEAAGCQQTLQFVRVLWAKYPFGFQDQKNIRRFELINREHQAILDMLQAGDSQGVLDHFRKHLTAGKQWLDKLSP
ncbi:MAG TPA: GntR family transcriptional regulator [Bordetella sp.]